MKQKNEEGTGRKTIREKFIELLELPKELVLNTPRLTMVGNSDLMVENHKGIVEFGDKGVKIITGTGIIKITGFGLLIKEITSEDIIISGSIDSIEFSSAG
jgi:sporulation protein YqfC